MQRAAYNAEHEPDLAMTPLAAQSAMVAGAVDLVPLDSLAGRIAATLIVVYPPGIAVMVPGERFGPNSAATESLRLFEGSDNAFPGFEAEMQGIFPRRDEERWIRYHTYVVREA